MRAQNPSIIEVFKKPKRKTYTLVGVTAIVVGFLIFFALRPTFIKISELNKEIEDKEVFLEKIDNKLTTINELIRQKQSIEKELVYFEEDFPEEKKSGFLVANLAAIADKFNVLLKSVSFDEDLDEKDKANIGIENPDLVRVISVNVTLEGEVPDFEKYIDYIESFPRIFDIRSVSYVSNDITEYSDNLEEFVPNSASITMYVYYWNKAYDEAVIKSVDGLTEEEEILQEYEN